MLLPRRKWLPWIWASLVFCVVFYAGIFYFTLPGSLRIVPRMILVMTSQNHTSSGLSFSLISTATTKTEYRDLCLKASLEHGMNTTMNMTSNSTQTASVQTVTVLHTPLFVQSEGGGRLGNNMFQYAASLGVSKRLGHRPLTSSKLLADTFRLTSVSGVTMQNPHVFGEEKAGAYDPCIEMLSPYVNWSLSGYYQSWRYFAHESDLVRSEFTFQDEIQVKVRTVFHDLGGRIKVGVHVRRGDLFVPVHIKRGYTIADEGYLRSAMKHYRTKLKDPLFVVVSDDINWCREHLSDPNVTFFHQDSAVDLAILAQCNHSIITTGTFGWWGAWLSGGDVIYYRKFPRKGSLLANVTNLADFFPPHWIGMD